MNINAARGSLAIELANRMGEITLNKVSGIGMQNAERNHSHIISGNSILGLRKTDLAKKKSALVIAAGPSIHRFDTAKMIKDSGFDGVIIATESAMAWCLRNDIVPDIAVTVDPHHERIVRWFGDHQLTADKVEEDDYFERQDMDPSFQADQIRFNRELIGMVDEHGPRIKLAIASSASPAVVERALQANMDMYWWNPFYDDYDEEGSITRALYEMNRKPCINAGGNVGTACWAIAHAVLGIKCVGLLGMDFSYYGDTTYRETQYYYHLIDLVGEDNLDKMFVHIDNPYTGSEFFTDPAYLWYRNVFLEMARDAAADGVRTHNCTGGGILFGDGVDFTGFDKFVEVAK